MRHEYIGRIRSEGEQKRQATREELDATWKKARIDAELARQKVHQAKLLEMKGALIPRQLVQRQASFLVLSMRARLLQIPEQHANELLNISDRREMTLRLDGIVRGALETLADMPLKVTDPSWMQKLDDVEQPAKHRVAK